MRRILAFLLLSILLILPAADSFAPTLGLLSYENVRKDSSVQFLNLDGLIATVTETYVGNKYRRVLMPGSIPYSDLDGNPIYTLNGDFGKYDFSNYGIYENYVACTALGDVTPELNNVYVLLPHEYVNRQMFRCTCGYYGGKIEWAPFCNCKIKPFTEKEIPYYFHCDPYYQPIYDSSNKINKRGHTVGKSSELAEHVFGYDPELCRRLKNHVLKGLETPDSEFDNDDTSYAPGYNPTHCDWSGADPEQTAEAFMEHFSDKMKKELVGRTIIEALPHGINTYDESRGLGHDHPARACGPVGPAVKYGEFDLLNKHPFNHHGNQRISVILQPGVAVSGSGDLGGRGDKASGNVNIKGSGGHSEPFDCLVGDGRLVQESEDIPRIKFDIAAGTELLNPLGKDISFPVISYYHLDNTGMGICTALVYSAWLKTYNFVGCHQTAAPQTLYPAPPELEYANANNRCYYLLHPRSDLKAVADIVGEGGNYALYGFLNSDMHIISTGVGCVQDLGLKIFLGDGDTTLLGMIMEAFYKVILACLVIYLMLVAYKIMTAGEPPKKGEMLMYVIKFALVLFFTTNPYVWIDRKDGEPVGLVPNIVEGQSELVNIFLSAYNKISPSGFFCSYNSGGSDIMEPGTVSVYSGYGTRGTGTTNSLAKITVWDGIDCRIINWVNLGGCEYGGMIIIDYLLAGLNIFGWLFVIAQACYIAFLASAILKFVGMFLVAFFMILILIALSPILIVFALFEPMKSVYQQWFLTVLGFMLLPALLFGFLSLSFTMMDTVFYGPKVMEAVSNSTTVADVDWAEACRDEHSIFCLRVGDKAAGIGSVYDLCRVSKAFINFKDFEGFGQMLKLVILTFILVLLLDGIMGFLVVLMNLPAGIGTAATDALGQLNKVGAKGVAKAFALQGKAVIGGATGLGGLAKRGAIAGRAMSKAESPEARQKIRDDFLKREGGAARKAIHKAIPFLKEASDTKKKENAVKLQGNPDVAGPAPSAPPAVSRAEHLSLLLLLLLRLLLVGRLCLLGIFLLVLLLRLLLLLPIAVLDLLQKRNRPSQPPPAHGSGAPSLLLLLVLPVFGFFVFE